MTTTTTPTANVADRGGKFVHANGIDIHYYEAGSGDPLILLHGGLMSAGPAFAHMPVTYYPYMEQLGTEFHVIAPDMRGQGGTIHTEGPIDFNVLADDVAALIDALGLERAFIAGFSEGGALATVVALHHPDKVRALVNHAGQDMFDPTAMCYSMAPMMLGGRPDATAADPDAFAAFFAQDPGMAAMFDAVKADIDGAQGEGAWRAYVTRTFDRWTKVPAGHTYEDFASITIPTLLLLGDRDHFCTPELATAEYRLLPAGELQVLANTEHAVTPEVVEATRAFFLRHQ